MSVNSQQYANLADHCYDRENMLPALAKSKEVFEIDGVDYKVLEHVDNPRNGYQGTVYQQVASGAIVVAHRGTEPGREFLRDVIIADGGMVATRSNSQADDAIALTRRALDVAREEGVFIGHTPEVTVTGHSLGGTLAQITAHHFDLRGETFNAYGAVSLDRRIPEGGSTVLNHVIAADVVGAGSPHYGQVQVYATPGHIAALRDSGGYDNTRSPFDLRAPGPVLPDALEFHGMHNFRDVDGLNRPDVSVLRDPQARQRAAAFDPMIDKFRSDIGMIRTGATVNARGGAGLVRDAFDALRGDLEPGEPARREAAERARSQRGFIDGPAHGDFHGAPLPGYLTPGAARSERAPHTPQAHTPGPDHAHHPQHGLLRQLRGQVREREREGAIRFGDDGERERFCRYALAACRDNRDELRGLYPARDFGGPATRGIDHADHLVIGTKQHAFVVQGDIRNPAAQRVAFTMDQARQTPVEHSDQKLEQANLQATQQMAMARQHDPPHAVDEPARAGMVR